MDTTTRSPAAIVRNLGRADYRATWDAMRAFTAARSPETPDEIWVVEHAPVFTLGQAGKLDHLLLPGEIPVVPTDRGGQVTYHGPGQVVAYPLVDLRRLGIYVKELVFRPGKRAQIYGALSPPYTSTPASRKFGPVSALRISLAFSR